MDIKNILDKNFVKADREFNAALTDVIAAKLAEKKDGILSEAVAGVTYKETKDKSDIKDYWEQAGFNASNSKDIVAYYIATSGKGADKNDTFFHKEKDGLYYAYVYDEEERSKDIDKILKFIKSNR